MGIALVAGLIAGGASAIVTGVFSWAAFAIGAGMTMVTRALTPKLDLGAQMGGRSVMAREAASSRKIIYGRARVGGNVVYLESTGTDNKYLWLVTAVAGHEIDAFEEVWFNDKKVWDGGVYQSTWATPGTSSTSPYVDINFYTGNQTAADSDLVAASNKWTTDHKLLDTAYMVVKLTYDAEQFSQGLPNISTIVRGKKVLHTAEVTAGNFYVGEKYKITQVGTTNFIPIGASSNTVGVVFTATNVGSGTGKANIIDWSQNPALCIRDYLTDTKYGLGESLSNILSSSVNAAVAVCNQPVDLLDNTTQARYTIDGVVDTGQSIKANIELMIGSMAGRLIYSSGYFEIHAGSYVAPSITVDESQIIGAITVQTKQTRRSAYNAVKGVFLSEEDNYVLADYPVQVSKTAAGSFVTGDRYKILTIAGTDFTAIGASANTVGLNFTATGAGSGSGTASLFLAEDDEQIFLDMPLPFTVNNIRAQRLARLALMRSRQQETITIPCNLSALRFTIGENINVTNTRLGYNQKVFEVVGYSIGFESNGEIGVNVQAIETASSVWSWGTADEEVFLGGGEVALYDGTFTERPASISVAADSYMSEDGTFNPYFSVTWPASVDAFVDHYIVEWRTGSGDYFSQATKTSPLQILNLQDGASYNVRVKAVNGLGVQSLTRDATPTAATDATPPGVPTNPLATGEYRQITISWTNPTQKDLKAVEVFRSETLDGTYTYVGSGDTSLIDTDLETPKTYYYKIRSYDFTFNKSNYTAIISATSRNVNITAPDNPDVIIYDGESGLPPSVTSGRTSLDTNTSTFYLKQDYKESLKLHLTYPVGALTSGSVAGQTNAINSTMAAFKFQVFYALTSSPTSFTQLGLDVISVRKTTTGQLGSNYYVKTTDLGGGNFQADLQTASQVQALFPTLDGLSLGIIDDNYNLRETLLAYDFPAGEYVFKVVVTVTDGSASSYPATGSPATNLKRKIDAVGYEVFKKSGHTFALKPLYQPITIFRDDSSNEIVRLSEGADTLELSAINSSGVPVQAFVGGGASSTTTWGARIQFDDDLDSYTNGGIGQYQIGIDKSGTRLSLGTAPSSGGYPRGLNPSLSELQISSGRTDIKGTLYLNDVAVGTGSGSISSVIAGTNLSGGGTSGAVTLNLDATIAGNHTFSNNIIISGDLTVNGTTTTVDTDNLNVKDKNITVNYSAGDSSSTANGAGITIQDAVNSTTNATMLWDTTNDEFDFSHNITAPNLSISNWNTAYTVANAALPKAGGTLTGGLSGTTGAFSSSLTATSLDVSGLVEFDSLSGTGSVAITNILDEDNMASNSATALATQQSIKAYVLANINTGSFLPLSGGTLTGGLSGTTASFSSTVSASEFDLPSGGQLDWASGDARIVEGLVNNYSLSFQTYDGSNLTTALRLDGNNAATFSGAVSGSSVASTAGSITSYGSIKAGQGGVYTNNVERISNAGNLTSIGTINSGAITSSASVKAIDYRVNEGNSLAGGLFKEKNVTGSGSSNDLSIFAEGISDGGNIHFMTGGSATIRATIDSSGNSTFGGTISSGPATISGVGTTSSAYSLRVFNGASTPDDLLSIRDDGAIYMGGPSSVFITKGLGLYVDYNIGVSGLIYKTGGADVEVSGSLRINSGGLKIGTQEVITSGRNLTNIGTINSGAISSTGNSTHGGYSSWTAGSGTGGIFMHYNSSNSYRGYFDWRTLQLGNNGANNILAGNTSVGGYFKFWVNATAISQSGATSGINALTISAAGNSTFSGSIDSGAITSSSTGSFTGNVSANGVTIGASDVRSSTNILTIGGTSEVVRIHSGNFDLTSGVFKVGGQTVIDASRNLKSIATVDTNLKLTSNTALSSTTSGGTVRILFPGNGSHHQTGSTATGAIKIVLPVGMTNGMLTIKGIVYEYSTNRSFEFCVGGYNYPSGNTWQHNPFGYITTSALNTRDYAIRFGYDGSKACIYIGETNTSWSYPQVSITECTVGYSSFGADTWDDGWDVTFATSFQNVTHTIASSDSRATLQRNANLDAASFSVGGTGVIDASRNLTNIGTISSGAITSSGGISGTTAAFTDTVTMSGSGTLNITKGLGVYISDNLSVSGLIYKTGGGDVEVSGNLRVNSGGLKIGTTTVIDASRNATFAKATLGSGTNYPLQVSSTQRYQMQIRNENNTVNSSYGWWLATDTNFNFALHADGSADKFTLTRDGNATFVGTISSGAITSSGEIAGTNYKVGTTQIVTSGRSIQNIVNYSGTGEIQINGNLQSTHVYNSGSYYVLNTAGNGWNTVVNRGTGDNFTVNSLGGFTVDGTTVIDASRNISAGTATLSSTTNMLLTLNPTAGNYGGIVFQYGGVTKGASIYNSGMMAYGGESGIHTVLQAGGQYGLKIDASTRNVGIGTALATPSDKLHVTGTIRGDSYKIGTTTVIDASRNLTSIGTYSGFGNMTTRAANVVIDAQSSADGQTVGFRAGYLNHTTLAGHFRYTTGDAQLYIDNAFVGNNAQYSTINFRNCPAGSSSLTTRLKIHGSSGNLDVIGSNLQMGGQTVITSGRALTNITGATFTDTVTMSGSGTLNVTKGLGVYITNNLSVSGLIYNTDGSDVVLYGDTSISSGDLDVSGALSKGSGSFKIDHPLPEKRETHKLVHSFVEAPQADNIYRGKVTLVDGSATVNIDTVAGMSEGTYVLLNTNTQCFTSNESGWTAVKGLVSGNILTIEAKEPCSDTISWMVVGERHDQHMIDTKWTDENGKVIVEPEKTLDANNDKINKLKSQLTKR